MKVKNLLPVVFAIFLLPCVFAFTACDSKDKVTDVRVTGAKATFQLGEQFSFGDEILVEKQINNKTWKEVPVSEYSYDEVNSNFNKDVAGTYTIYITIDKIDQQPSYTVTVEKGTTAFVSISPLDATYGQLLADVQLPQGYTWVTPSLQVGDVTDSNGRAFDVIYVKNSNYHPVTGQVSVVVQKATPEFVAPEPITTTWVSTMTKLESITLPAGYEWASPQAYLGDATDSQGKEFDVIYTKSSNHNPVEGKVKVIVEKADGVFYSLPGALKAVYGQTLSNIPLPSNNNEFYVWADPNLSVGDVTGNGTRQFQVIFTLKNHKPATGMASVRVNPAPALPFVAIDPVTAEYGQTLADVQLPAGYTWVDETQSVGDVTSEGREFAVYHQPNPNYEASSGEVTVIVTKATPQILTRPQIPSGVTCYLPVGDTPIVGGKAVNAKNEEIEGTFVWENPNAAATSFVNKSALTIKFVPNDTENYAEVTGMNTHISSLVVNPCDINLIPNKLISVNSAYYKGEEVEPYVQLKAKFAGNTNFSIIGVDNYTVSYSNNIDIGYGKVTLTGKNCLTGSASALFEIKPELVSYTLDKDYTIEIYKEELNGLSSEEAYEYILGDVKVYGVYAYIDEPMLLEFSRYNLCTENWNYLNLYTYDTPQVLYASYQSFNDEYSVTVTIKSTVVESMTVDYSAFQTVYRKTNSSSNDLDFSQIKATETYASGITKELTYDAEVKSGCFTATSDYDSDVVGTYTVTIHSYYKSATTGETATCKFNIEVVQGEPVVTSIDRMELVNPVFVGGVKNNIYFNIYANFEGEDEPRFYKTLQATNIVSKWQDGFQFVTDMTGETETTFDNTTTNTQYVKYLSQLVDGVSNITFVGSFALTEDYMTRLGIKFANEYYSADCNNETPIDVAVPYSATGEVGTITLNSVKYLSGKNVYASNVTDIEIIGLDDVDSTIPQSSYPVQLIVEGSEFNFNFVVGNMPESLNFTLDIEELYQDYTINTTEGIEGVVLQGLAKTYDISVSTFSESFVLTFNFASNTASLEGQYWFDNKQTASFTKDFEANSIKLYWNDAQSISMNIVVKDERIYDYVIQTINITKNASPFNSIKINETETPFESFAQLESVPYGSDIEITTDIENAEVYLNNSATTSINMDKTSYLSVVLKFHNITVWEKYFDVHYFNKIETRGQTFYNPSSDLKIELEEDKTAVWFKFDAIVDLEDLYYISDGTKTLKSFINISNITSYKEIEIYYDMGGDIGGWLIMKINIYPFSHVEELQYEYVPFIGMEQLVSQPMTCGEFRSFATSNLDANYAVEAYLGYFSNIKVALKSDYSAYTYEFTLADGTAFDFKKHNEKGDIYLKIYDENEELVETIVITYLQYLTPIVGESYATRIYGEWYVETTSKANTVAYSTASMTVTNDTKTVAEFTAPAIITHNFTAMFGKGGQTYEIYSSVVINYSEVLLKDVFNELTFAIIDPTITNYYDEEERYSYFDIDLYKNILESNYGNVLNPYHNLEDVVTALNLNKNNEYSLTSEYAGYTPTFSVDGKNIKVVISNSTTTKTAMIKMVYVKQIDNNVDLQDVALFGLTGKIDDIEIVENTITATDMSKIKAIMVFAENQYAKLDLYNVVGEGDETEDVYMYSEYGIASLIFSKAGHYKLVITSSDATTTKTINIVVQGDFPPMLETTIGDDVYTFDMDIKNFAILGDFQASLDMDTGAMEKLEIYLGTPEEDIDTLDMSIRSCFQDIIYDYEENPITDLENVKLEILADDSDRKYAMIYSNFEGMMVPVYFYLYEKSAPLTITFGNTTFAIEIPATGISNSLGDFQVMENVGVVMSNFDALGLEITDTTATATIKFAQTTSNYNYSILADISLMGSFDFTNQEHLDALTTSATLTQNVEFSIMPADVEIGAPPMILFGIVIGEIGGIALEEAMIMPLAIVITG